MAFPERFSNLPDYAFPRLRKLLDNDAPGGPTIHMSLGEPKHPFPHWVPDVLAEYSAGFSVYPPNAGTPELLSSISDYLTRRFDIQVEADSRIMVLNGTREGLFNACLALSPETTPRGEKPVVLIPNPFYQVYAVAALAAGAEPVFLPAVAGNDFLPDFSAVPVDILNRTTVAYLCTPSNPQGAVAGLDYLRSVIALAQKFDFQLFSDECYGEIYRDSPPPSALQALGDQDPERVLAFHSLSKRSNLPGLRSGFVVGGPASIEQLLQLRSYAGAPVPLPTQRVSERLWADDAHAAANRAMYVEKYEIADDVFQSVQGFSAPEAGFFLWLPVEDGETVTRQLWKETGVRVLPGSYLGREVAGTNPGSGYIRVALVAPKEEMQRGLIAIRDCLYT